MKARSSPKRGSGRPQGRNYGPAIRARLPHELDYAARSACKLLGISMSRLIRAGIEAKLTELVPKVVEIVDDPKTQPMRCMRLMEFLRDMALGSVALHKLGPLAPTGQKPVRSGPVLPSLRIRRPDIALRRLAP